jgi:hypothetical protein
VTGDEPLPHPPAGSGVEVEETAAGRRITLPRLYTRADLIVTAVAAALAVWMAVWVRDLAADYPRQSTLGLSLMAAVGLVFAGVALSQGLRIVARRVIQGSDDGLVLARQLGARTVGRRAVASADIAAVARVRDESDVRARVAGSVWVRTGDGNEFLGRGLDPETLAWLEDAVRRMARARRPEDGSPPWSPTAAPPESQPPGS